MKFNKWMKVAIASFLVIAALVTYKVMEIKAAIAFGESFPEHSETVELVVAEKQSYLESVRVLGEVISPQQVALRSELQGRIVEVGFRSGENVAKDQLLLQLDISEELAQLDSASARMDLAETIFKRNSELRKRNAVSQEQLDRAKAELATIKAEIAGLKSTIRKKTIRAPFAGVTGIHQFEVGQFLLGNILITQLIGRQDFLWVDFSLPQFYPALEPGTKIQVALITQGATDQWVEAEVVVRSAVVSVENRSFQYRAKVMRAVFPAIINAAVTVKVPVAAEKEVISIPVAALQHDNLGKFVFILEEDKAAKGFRAVRQAVNVVAHQAERILLDDGVAPGQKLAGAGAFKLYPGLLVIVRQELVKQIDQEAGAS